MGFQKRATARMFVLVNGKRAVGSGAPGPPPLPFPSDFKAPAARARLTGAAALHLRGIAPMDVGALEHAIRRGTDPLGTIFRQFRSYKPLKQQHITALSLLVTDRKTSKMNVIFFLLFRTTRVD